MSPSATPSGTASCAMSARKACDVRIAVASEIGAAMLPTMTLSSAVFGIPSGPMPVITWGMPFGPGMKLPYGSVRSSGTLPTS